MRCDDDDGAFPSSGNDDIEEDDRTENDIDIGSDHEYDTRLILRSIDWIAPNSGALRGHRHRHRVVVDVRFVHVVVGTGVFAFGTTSSASPVVDRRERD